MTNNTLRLHHIDLLRGLIIIFMILDHAMVYCSEYFVNDPMDIPGTETKIFLSRFISHFCAPLFVFLAGLSAALTEIKHKDDRSFSIDLIKRGAVLILLEFTLISWSWSFNPIYPMLYAQVIWAIGWGFIFLGLFRLIGPKMVLAAGTVIVLGHNLLDPVRFQEHTVMHYLWSVLHQKNVLALPFNFQVRTTYPVLSIIGLMALGYSAGRYYVSSGFAQKTERFALATGVLCLCLYSILRVSNIYGDPGLFEVHSSFGLTMMSFFNPTKYPLSLQFMLLTVGLGLLKLVGFRQLNPRFSAGFLQVLGKTSMFSYILHLYLLHAISWLLIPLLGYAYSDMTYGETLIGLPKGFGLSYIATLVLAASVVWITQLLAKRYIRWKKSNKHTLIAKYI